MKLFYVTHEVVTTKRFALIAEDEEQLKRVLAEREAAVSSVKFSPKLERDKQGKVIGHELSKDWPTPPHQPPWEGTVK